MTDLKPCPFCGGEVKIGFSDDEGNNRDENYKDDPWSGLTFRLVHYVEDNENCPIATYGCDGKGMGVYLYETEEKAIAAWNTRAHTETLIAELEDLHDTVNDSSYADAYNTGIDAAIKKVREHDTE